MINLALPLAIFAFCSAAWVASTPGRPTKWPMFACVLSFGFDALHLGQPVGSHPLVYAALGLLLFTCSMRHGLRLGRLQVN
jgi:hypothetical protein